MGWFWAFFWIPMGLFVASRVRRRIWRRRMMYRHGYFGGPGCGPRGGYGWRGRGPRGWERDWDAEEEDDFEDEPRSFRRRGRGRLLSGLFRKLDTTPGQEKALRELVEGLGGSLGDARSELMASRRDLAAAFSSEAIDQAALDRAFQRNTDLLTKLSGELKTALASAHQTLDSEQRKYLAELISRGPFRGPFGRHAFEL